MFATLGVQHAIRTRHIVICGLPSSTLIFIITSKCWDFQKKIAIQQKMRVVIFFTTLSETFLILRNWVRFMYFYWKSLCTLIVVYVRVFLLLSMYVYSYCSSMYSYCCLCILIVVYVFLLFVHVFLLFVHVFLLLSMYTYCCLRILRRSYPDWGFSVLFPPL